MEGLLLAEALAPLLTQLPLERGAWRFPDDRTAVLPLSSPGAPGALWIVSRPPAARLAVVDDTPAAAPARTPFQEQLAARAVGPLVALRQQGLDRVVELDFGERGGFVPNPAVTLVAELTGRNANLVLLDGRRTVLGVERVVLADRNRYRELRPGLSYRPPPPYDKLDPRTATSEALRAALAGRRLNDVRSLLDGIGPELAAALAAGCGVEPEARLEGAELEAVLKAVQRLAHEPSAWLAARGPVAGLAAARQRERREKGEAALRTSYRRRLELAERRLDDAERSIARAGDGERLRRQADLLMAYPHAVAAGAARARLTGFDGEAVDIELDPGLDVFANARKRYDRARRLEERARRAERERPALQAERSRWRAELEAVGALSDEELEDSARELAGERRRSSRPSGPGIRFFDPHGFEVVVGRNARENEAVTFGVARSRDLWLHVQGLTGSHVVVRAGGREVPFATVLFAARLAAGFSAARQSDNVAVDYTLRKHVWKVKGHPAGSVHFSHQRTVYVTPARDAVTAETAGPDGSA